MSEATDKIKEENWEEHSLRDFDAYKKEMRGRIVECKASWKPPEKHW